MQSGKEEETLARTSGQKNGAGLISHARPVYNIRKTGGILMTGKRTFLIVQSVLCALAAAYLAAAALALYLDGAARQAEGDLFYAIYTREKVADWLLPVLPLLIGGLGMAVGGVILGIRDENQDKPLRDEMRDWGGLRDRAVRQTAGSRERCTRAAVMALAAALIAAGILNGGLADVLAKGAAICMECVGLG